MNGREVVVASAIVAASLCGCKRGDTRQPSPVATVGAATATAEPAAVNPEDTHVIAAFAEGEPDQGPAPLTVKFSVWDPFMRIEEPVFDWDFGDGTPHSDKPRPVHTYERPGRYTARMKVVDQGATDDDTVDIVVTPPYTPTPASSAP